MQDPVAREVNASGGKVVVAGTIGTVVVSVEDLIKNAYETRNVSAPSAPELRSIADLLAYLSPVVVGRSG